LIGTFSNILKIPELKRRIIITFLLLAVYRIGVHVPTPGINSDALASFFAQARGTLFGLFDMFTGGALERFSVFALGIMPYISASIIMELLSVVIPYIDRLKKEGESGRKKIIQYTRYGTVLLSLIQSFGIAMGLRQMESGGLPVVTDTSWTFIPMTMITLTAGTAFIMWLGEQITIRLMRTGELQVFLILAILMFMVVVVGFIIFMETGQRRLSVQYAKRIVGRRVYGGQSTHLPLKINTAGVIPAIFASSILMFPLTITQFMPKAWMEAYPWLKNVLDSLGGGTILYNVLYVAFIIFFCYFFCYFYTAIVFNPDDVAENMKKFGGYIPGIRPGKKTAEYIDRILSRITLGGALYVSAVCVLPTILIRRFNVPFYFGGTALLIVVGVALDTVQQIESHLLTRQYEGLMRKGRLRVRRR
jgi:preprotein translocase subunit SecY